MILDAFMFCHELDMLEFRLRVLYDHVDKFVILECDTTHANNPKPYYFEENKARFDWAKDKIVHLKGNHFKDIRREWDFTYENAQREFLYEETVKLCHEDDIILISDIDEIPSREAIESLKNEVLPVIFEQDLYYYNITFPRNKKWLGTIAMHPNSKNFLPVRTNRSFLRRIPGGWHFTYFMTPSEIKQKVGSFAHHDEYGKTKEEYIENCITYNKDFLGKKNGSEDPIEIPDYIMNEVKKFPVFMGVQ